MSPYPTAILFDLDDTLISFEGVSSEALETSCRRFCAQYQPAFAAAALLDAMRQKQQWFWSDPQRHTIGRKDIRQARRDIASMALADLGRQDTDAVCFLADQYTDLHNALTCLYPQTLPVLEMLRRKGVRLALLTNGTSQGQREKVSRFGLAGYFEHILIEGELGFGKPDIRVFEHALSLLGLEGRETWMVGDNLVWDIAPPQTLGIHAIWHDYRKAGLQEDADIIPDRIIHDIGELAFGKDRPLGGGVHAGGFHDGRGR